ncbi:MAG: O-antigen ligase family protein [Candidatus Hydrogenedentota bacterium]
MTRARWDSIVDNILPWLVTLGVFTFALAMPWEIYQRTPFLGLTLTKLSAGAIIAAAGVCVLRGGMRPWPRHALEGPILLFAAAFAISTVLSENPAQSARHAAQYAVYLVFFYGLLLTLRDSGLVRASLYLFSYSALAVAALALACAAGLATPVFVEAIHPLGHYVSSEMRSGAALRMAATSPDFNQGVLPMVLAFPVVLVAMGRSIWTSYLSRAACAGLLTAGIVVSFSRSSLLVVALMLVGIAYAAWGRKARFGWPMGIAVTAALLIVGVLAGTYGEALLDRARQGFVTRDPSLEGRWYVFEVAGRVLPRYALLGTGPGMSDAVLEEAADPGRWHGVTLHSVPGKLLLETGIFGLLAYFWFWERLLRATWKGWTANRLTPEGRLYGALLLAFGGCFLILLIQPFMTLSLFPFLAALPFCLQRDGGVRADSPVTRLKADSAQRRRWGAGLAAAAVIVIAAPNIVRYHETAARMDEAADALYAGINAERNGALRAAETAYAEGREILSGVYGQAEQRGPWYAPPAYLEEASQAPDFGYLREHIGAGYHGLAPPSLAAFALGRVRHDRGRVEEALAPLDEALERVPGFAHGRFVLAETQWKQGDFTAALEAYRAARESAAEDYRNNAFREKLDTLRERVEELSLTDTAAARLEQAHARRRLGQWDEAMEQVNALTTSNTVPAEALYLKGIDAELRAKPAEARSLYRQTLEQTPNHWQARQRLGALENAPTS